MIAKYRNILLASLMVVFVAFSANILLSAKSVFADHPGPCTSADRANGASAVEETVNGVTTCKVTPAASNSGGKSSTTDDSERTCQIDKIGWILCPVIETSAKIGDQAFQFLAGTFLETEPELVATYSQNTTPSGTYRAWELARNIANVMFIIAFLIIILSQVTGRGLDNYGIKKTLPRLIIAAIAVNVSYFICQVMVDLSNILGYELQKFLVDMAGTVSDRTAMPIGGDSFGKTGNGTGVLAIISGVILVSAGIVMVLLPILTLGVATIVITCLVVIVILLLRKALIVLLVVLSPIAFVLYLLPNTEQYFRKWLSMFWKLLMVFPVVGLLLGAGQLASAIVLVAGSNTAQNSSTEGVKNYYDDGGEKCVTLPFSTPPPGGFSEASESSCATGSTPLLLGLVAAGIAVAPLLAVWSVLKGALAGAGAIGGKISGAVETYTGKGVEKLGKGPGQRMSKRANIMANRQGVSGGIANIATAGAYRRRAKKKAIDAGLDKEVGRAELDYTSKKAQDSSRFRQQLSGGVLVSEPDAQQRAEANAISQQRSLEDENKKAAHATVDLMTPDKLVEFDEGTGKAKGKLIEAINSGKTDSAQTAAMIERAMQAGSAVQKEAIIDSLKDAKFSLATRTASDALAQNNPGYISASQLDAIRLGEHKASYREMALDSIVAGKFTPEKMANADKHDVKYAFNISQNNKAAQANLGQAAHEAVSNEKIRGAIKDNRQGIEAMLKWHPSGLSDTQSQASTTNTSQPSTQPPPLIQPGSPLFNSIPPKKPPPPSNTQPPPSGTQPPPNP